MFCGMFSRISAKSLRAFYGEVLPATQGALIFFAGRDTFLAF